MQLTTLVQAVRQIQASDKRWIPQELEDYRFFGNYDLWEYYELGDPESECEFCKVYANQVFTGAQLRNVFPDLEIEGPYDIYPNVHMTLWGAKTCKCKLIRVNQEKITNPEQLVVYTGEKTPYYTKEGYKYDAGNK